MEEMFCVRPRCRFTNDLTSIVSLIVIRGLQRAERAAVCVLPPVWRRSSSKTGTRYKLKQQIQIFVLFVCRSVSSCSSSEHMKCFYFGWMNQRIWTWTFGDNLWDGERGGAPVLVQGFSCGGLGADWSWMLTGYELPALQSWTLCFKTTPEAPQELEYRLWQVVGPMVLLGTRDRSEYEHHFWVRG